MTKGMSSRPNDRQMARVVGLMTEGMSSRPNDRQKARVVDLMTDRWHE